jgi:Trypsin-co-occurring domain 1
MNHSDDGQIPFVVEVTTKGVSGVAKALVPVDELRRSLRAATAKLGEAFEDIRRVGQFELAEVTLGLEVGVEGGVHFIGTSKVSGSGSITLKFSPPRNEG